MTNPSFSNATQVKTGLVGFLAQLAEDDEEKPVAYMSKKLNPAQRNYSVTEQECLAAVLGIKKFRAYYIEGHKFKVITDHASLKWLMTQKIRKVESKVTGVQFRN